MTPDRGPHRIYRYAAAKRAGGLLFVSGQVSRDDIGRIVGAGDFNAQMKQALRNLDRVLATEGASLPDIVKLTGYIADSSYRDAYIAVLDQAFPLGWPAHTLLTMSPPDPEELVELEAVALVPGE